MIINLNKIFCSLAFIMLFIGVDIASSQCIKTENGDEMSIKLILNSNTYVEDYIVENLMDCDENIDITKGLFTYLELTDNEFASIFFYNGTKDTVYYYSIEKMTFNWRVKSNAEEFGHILLDGEEITFSFKSGCTFFHIKLYNPKDDEDDNNNIWFKVWKE
jgi:hypothetical protein